MPAPVLLAGPYHPPPVKRGDRETCLYRDGDVIITTWSDAPIQWPRCRRVGNKGGSGLLVTEETVRALKTESSIAVQYWFGISQECVGRWRKAFGVEQWGTEGSKRLLQQNSEAGAEATRGKSPPRGLAKRRAATRKAGNYPPPPSRWPMGFWKAEEIALLGTMPDKDLAQQLGRSYVAVRRKRREMGIPPYKAPG